MEEPRKNGCLPDMVRSDMPRKKTPERNTIFSPNSLRKLGSLESESWLRSQIDNFQEGSFLSAFRIYESEKTLVSESEKLATIFGQSEYFVLGNGEIVISSLHHNLLKAKELGFRIL